jgi:hypothetical protein
VAANVDGSVLTAVAETIQAHGRISMNEGFAQWVATSSGSPATSATAAGDVLTAPASSGGLAIAVYEHTELQLPKHVPEQGWRILYGIVNDAPGVAIPLGGGPPVPVGPWGPIVARLVSAMYLHAGASGLTKAGGAAVREVAAAEIAEIAKEIAKVAERGSGGR